MLTQTQCDIVLSRYERGGYSEAGKAAVQMLREPSRLRDLLTEIDSELSAIAHGRPPADKQKLVELYLNLRHAYNSLG